jgi:hypothetical protein
MYVLSITVDVSVIKYRGTISECLLYIDEQKNCDLTLVLIREDDLMELWSDDEIKLSSESENELLYGKNE